MLKRLRRAAGELRNRVAANGTTATEPMRVVAPTEHGIAHNQFSASALKVTQRLIEGGFEAYLVGGCVRDLLLDSKPKDFDVATSARPEDVRALFRNSRIIGRRFRIVHVHFGREIVEVTTFRGNHPADDDTLPAAVRSERGMLLRDNVYGTLAEDAVRRDFTINALYYAPADASVRDFCGGIDDIDRRLIRIIGDAETRYREDPVRMLRALRFAARLDFALAEQTAEPLGRLAPLLHDVAPARLFDECLKLFFSGCGQATFTLLEQHQLLGPLFPATARCLLEDDAGNGRDFVSRALANTDKRVRAGQRVTPAFLFAALLWPALAARTRALEHAGEPPATALQRAIAEVLAHQVSHVAIPRRFTAPMREIWLLQSRLERRNPRSIESLVLRPRFRAGYDFLLLREAAGEPTDAAGAWWTEFQNADDEQRAQLIAARKPAKGGGRRRRRRRSPPA